MPGAALVRDTVDFMLASYAASGVPERAQHPLEVAALLVDAGAGPDLVATGVLHDVVEDTAASGDDVRERFGPRIAALVGVLTEDVGIADSAERKLMLREAVALAGADRREVFAADKVARLRAAERDGVRLAPENLEHYRRSSQMLAGRRPRPGYADELADRLHEGTAGALHDRGERLAEAARAAAARSAELEEDTRAVLAQTRQAVGAACRAASAHSRGEP